ncbi:MAG: hypothetical protein ABJR23_21625, partial [Paracoccaceae bacterium]
VYKLFLPDLLALNHGLERRSATTHFALMSSFDEVSWPTKIDAQFLFASRQSVLLRMLQR